MRRTEHTRGVTLVVLLVVAWLLFSALATVLFAVLCRGGQLAERTRPRH